MVFLSFITRRYCYPHRVIYVLRGLEMVVKDAKLGPDRASPLTSGVILVKLHNPLEFHFSPVLSEHYGITMRTFYKD